MSVVKQYRGAILIAINLILVLILVFGQNVLNLFSTGYAGASALLDAEEDEIAELIIQSPQMQAKEIRLVRMDTVKADSADQKVTSGSSPDSIENSKKLQYNWQLRVISNKGETQNYRVDPERLTDLLKGLQNVRDYYGMNRSPERDQEFQMTLDSEGHYQGIKLLIKSSPEAQSEELFIGKSGAQSSQSYVRLNQQETIYLVDVNLRSLLGSGERFFFRQRRIFPEAIQADTITMVDAQWQKLAQHIQIVKQNKEWVLVSPKQMPLDTNEVNALLRDVADLKADNFFKELPEQALSNEAFQLQVYYNAAGTITDQLNSGVLVIPKKDSSGNYYVQAKKDGDWMEINSIYLGDLPEASEKYRKRPEMRTFQQQ